MRNTMRFLKIRKGESKIDNLGFIKMEASRSNKRPLIFHIEAIIEKSRYHHCSSCFFNQGCDKQCGMLEASIGIQEFARKNFKIDVLNLSVTPIKVKKYKKSISKIYEIHKL